MIHLVTFSDESMSTARSRCVDSAMVQGVDGITWAFAATEADKSAGRGLGFWAWKPRIILDFLTDKTGGLAHPEDGDILIYSDAGVEFITNVSHIIDRMDQDIFLFGNNWEHAHWCKRDIVEEILLRPSRKRIFDEAVRLDKEVLKDSSLWDKRNTLLQLGRMLDADPWSGFRLGKQVQASVIFFRVSDFTRKFVKEWLDWCLFEGGRLIDDSPSRTPNHPEFQENRHDQAILTTLSYREGLRLHWWPAIYNDGAFTYEKGEYQDDYPPIFHHHRRRNHEWPAQPNPASAITCDATA